MDKSYRAEGAQKSDYQQHIDFDRGQQLAMLRDCRLPRVTISEGRQKRDIRPDCMKHLLRCIDDHGGGRPAWPSIETLAAEMHVTVRTVKRALAGLVEISLLCVGKRPISGDELAIMRRRLSRFSKDFTTPPRKRRASAA